jgi:hypothetical protein
LASNRASDETARTTHRADARAQQIDDYLDIAKFSSGRLEGVSLVKRHFVHEEKTRVSDSSISPGACIRPLLDTAFMGAANFD